jgi:hypothetical protein
MDLFFFDFERYERIAGGAGAIAAGMTNEPDL